MIKLCLPHRYLDITLGVFLLVSMVCLLYGTYSQSSHFLILFFILSLVVVISYWSWYVYINFVSQDSAVFEDEVSPGSKSQPLKIDFLYFW